MLVLQSRTWDVVCKQVTWNTVILCGLIMKAASDINDQRYTHLDEIP